MSVNFADNFWGEKNNGFEVLYHNMKCGQVSNKEFTEFLRESCNVEETYAKLLAKLAKTATNCGANGSCGPFWAVIKSLAEKLSNLRLQLVHAWQDLIKDVLRYSEEQHKRHKAIKDSESATQETVQAIQNTLSALHKAKETYHARCLDYEKLKRENGNQRDLEKAEAKYKKAIDEYRVLVEKYSNVRNDFEKRMTESCHRFQETEENHLCQMKDFVDTYSKAWEHQNALVTQVHEEFKANSAALTIEHLLGTLVKNKTTGTEVPGPLEFEQADLSGLAPPPASDSQEKKEIPLLEKPSKAVDAYSGSTEAGAPEPKLSLRGFLSKTRREKKKEKKKKKKEKDKDKTETFEAEQVTPEVDDEGFSIRPDNAFEPSDRTSWESSSDSDSDSEIGKKIKVEIKPANGTTPTGNVDEIKKSIEGLRLSPTSNRRTGTSSEHTLKKSMSLTDTLSASSNEITVRPNQDLNLLSLDLFGGSSNSSTPTADTNDYFASSPADGVPSSLTTRHRPCTPNTTPMIPIIGPPPVRQSPRSNIGAAVPYTYKSTARPAGRMSPAPNKMDRVDSLNNLSNNTVTFNTTSMPIGSSRGPSPLTIGMSDTIPLAIAFSEIINAYFKGTAESNCKVKLTGDMMVSFPAGIVKVLTENPSPAMLSFRIKNTQMIEQILVNKQLITQDTTQSTPDSLLYTFNMSTLTDHLRRQADVNKLASFFNIDILKYQVRVKPGIGSTPLHLVAYWKCDQAQTDFRLDYKYNRAAVGLPRPVTNVSVLVPVDGDVTHMQSKPTASWSSEHNRAIWKLGEVSNMNDDNGQGCLRAKFDLSDGPTTPSPVAVQFLCEGTTLSGVDFDLVGMGYRVSLVKKRFVTGKYVAEAESPIQYV